MARAGHGGDGHPTTRENTAVYVCDWYGVRHCQKNAPLKFEGRMGNGTKRLMLRPSRQDGPSQLDGREQRTVLHECNGLSMIRRRSQYKSSNGDRVMLPSLRFFEP
jgi:hypothetical protein